MKHETIDDDGLAYGPCRYGLSRIMFRGPKRRLDSPYLAFIGGTETYGKFIKSPFPAQIEKQTDRRCVNLGCVNGGVDAFVNDRTIMEICQNAQATVVQIMGANFLSNRFYSVHPRRNDRFLRASTVLQAIYDDVDFSDFTFTRAMLNQLYDMSPNRFEIVVSELREAWSARMRNMIEQIGHDVILLWFSRDPPSDAHWADQQKPLSVDPLFITKSMLDDLRPNVRDIVVAVPSDAAKEQGKRGMYVPVMQSRAASNMLSVASHMEACDALITRLP